MLRSLSLVSVVSFLSLAVVAVVVPACTVTTLDDDDDDDGGEGEGEGEEGEGEEGEGEGVPGPEDNDVACSDGFDNDDNGFTDCDDFDCDGTLPCAGPDVGVVKIQAIQDGTHADGSIASIEKVFVTATNTSGSGNLTLFVQEADGEGNGHTYPEFAGLGVFIISTAVTELGAGGIAVGDCINLSGQIGAFNGLTQLTFITAFSVAADCGVEPSPTVVDLLDIATDADPVEDLAQAGASAEAFEGVLVTVEGVTASTASDDNGFDVVDANDARLEVSDFLLGTGPTVAVDDTFTSITGVLARFNAFFQLEPRETADIVTP